jgi:hypothetical protein
MAARVTPFWRNVLVRVSAVSMPVARRVAARVAAMF